MHILEGVVLLMYYTVLCFIETWRCVLHSMFTDPVLYSFIYLVAKISSQLQYLSLFYDM